MKIKKLLEELKECNQDAVIKLHTLYEKKFLNCMHTSCEQGMVVLLNQKDSLMKTCSVKNLIEVLSEYPQDNQVVLDDFNGEEVIIIEKTTDIVFMGTENDCSIEFKKEFISSYLYRLTENDESVADTCEEMLDIGITPDMVKRIIGDTSAKTFYKLCIKHKLIEDGLTSFFYINEGEHFISNGTEYIKIRKGDLDAFNIKAVNAVSVNGGLTCFINDETVKKL